MKNKLIEELGKTIGNTLNSMQRYDVNAYMIAKACYKTLLHIGSDECFNNLGYYKIPEGSVVLDKQEYQEYFAYKIIEPEIKGCLDRERKLEKRVAELEEDLIHADENVFYREMNVVLREKEIKQQASKETAKEILQFLYCFPREFYEKAILELARRFDVKLEIYNKFI